ncbi:UPF0598 protein C8orf82 homolog isoform 1-T1 [Sylvia borin]
MRAGALLRLCSRPEFRYQQGQRPEPGIREYFYYLDHHGRLFLDDAKVKNFITCFKDVRFLSFFFRRLERNPLSPSRRLFPGPRNPSQNPQPTDFSLLVHESLPLKSFKFPEKPPKKTHQKITKKNPKTTKKLGKKPKNPLQNPEIKPPKKAPENSKKIKKNSTNIQKKTPKY